LLVIALIIATQNGGIQCGGNLLIFNPINQRAKTGLREWGIWLKIVGVAV